MTGESVEQAALRRADWQDRAEREAGALAEQSGITFAPRDKVLALIAASWLQGFNLGSHETLADAERAFDRIRAAL